VKFVRSALCLAAAAAAATAAPAFAADGTYTTEAGFLLAAGSTSTGISTESFEGLAGRSRSQLSIATAGFVIATAGAAIGVQTGNDTPDAGFGGSATDGTHWVSVYLPNQPQGSVTFTFTNPTLVFGLNLTDLGEVGGSVVLTTNAGAYASGVTLLSFPPTVGSGAVNYVGLTQSTPFTSVTLNVSGLDEAYGLDKVSISAVPEPATSLSLMAGLAGLAAMGASLRRSSVQ